MKVIYCDKCKREIKKGETFETMTFVHERREWHICNECAETLFRFSKEEL